MAEWMALRLACSPSNITADSGPDAVFTKMEVVGVVRRNVDAKPEPPWAWIDVFDESRERALSRAGSILGGMLRDFPIFTIAAGAAKTDIHILIFLKGKNEWFLKVWGSDV
jgi:hypothetical protein